MSFLPILIAVVAVVLAFVYKLYLHKWVVRLLQWLGAMPHSVSEKIFFTLWRTLYLNWYIVLMLVLLWVLLFGPDVGKDIIIDYRGNLQHYNGFLGKCGSLFFIIDAFIPDECFHLDHTFFSHQQKNILIR